MRVKLKKLELAIQSEYSKYVVNNRNESTELSIR